MRERRLRCKGDCGRWWYYGGNGRPREWCPDCYRTHVREGRVCEVCGFRRADDKSRHGCDERIARARSIVARAGASQAGG